MTEPERKVMVLKPLECLLHFHGKTNEIRDFLNYNIGPSIIEEWNRVFREDDAIKASMKQNLIYMPAVSADELRDWVLLCSWVALNQDSKNAFNHAVTEYTNWFAYIMLDFFSTVSVKAFPNDSIFAGTTIFNYLFHLSGLVYKNSDLEHKKIFFLLAKTHLQDEDMLDSIIDHYELHLQFDFKKNVTIH